MSDEEDDDDDGGICVISGFIAFHRAGGFLALPDEEVLPGSVGLSTRWSRTSCQSPQELPGPAEIAGTFWAPESLRGPFLIVLVAAADGSVPGWRVSFQGSAAMTNGEWREAMVPLRFVPVTSRRLRSTILGIIIVIECRWCGFLQLRQSEGGGWGLE